MTTNDTELAVLITGGRAPAALEWARLLHAAGCRVYVCDSLSYYVSRFSNAVAGAYTVPSPRKETEAFIDKLTEIISRHHIQTILPTCEEIFYLAKYRERLEAFGAELFADQLPALLKYHNKLEFIRTAAFHGFRVPDTQLLQGYDEWIEAMKDPSKPGPVVLKPVYSRFASQVQIIQTGPGQSVPQPPEHLSVSHPWVMQQYIEGTPVCTYSIVREGRVLAHAAYESRYRVGLGATIHFAAADHPALLNWVARFVEKEHFTGQIAFDFIVEKDGTPIPIECNPRATSGIHLFAPQSGIAEALFNRTFSDSSPLITPDADRKAMVGLVMSAYGLRRGLQWSERVDAMRELWRSRDVLFRWRDPLPVLGQGAALWSLGKLGRRHGINMLQASTIDLEWNGTES